MAETIKHDLRHMSNSDMQQRVVNSKGQVDVRECFNDTDIPVDMDKLLVFCKPDIIPVVNLGDATLGREKRIRMKEGDDKKSFVENKMTLLCYLTGNLKVNISSYNDKKPKKHKHTVHGLYMTGL